MAETCSLPALDPSAMEQDSLEERLERGEVVFFPSCPFPLPVGDDRRLLLQQESTVISHRQRKRTRGKEYDFASFQSFFQRILFHCRWIQSRQAAGFGHDEHLLGS